MKTESLVKPRAPNAAQWGPAAGSRNSITGDFFETFTSRRRSPLNRSYTPNERSTAFIENRCGRPGYGSSRLIFKVFHIYRRDATVFCFIWTGGRRRGTVTTRSLFAVPSPASFAYYEYFV